MSCWIEVQPMHVYFPWLKGTLRTVIIYDMLHV